MSAIIVNPFDRIIEITKIPVSGVLTIDVRKEIYSEAKDFWATQTNLFGMRLPLRPVGGDPVGSAIVGPYVFVNNFEGWRLLPHDSNHEMTLIGNIFAEDASIPLWLPREGRTITISIERSAQALTLTNIEATLDQPTQDLINGINEKVDRGELS